MGMTINDTIISIMRWIYTFKGYNLWVYKNKDCYMTEDYILFGKVRQRQLGHESTYYVMSCEYYKTHQLCE